MTKFNTLLDPIKAWKRRREEGDDLFTDENLEVSEKILENYLKKLENLEHPSDEKILSLIEAVVKELNAANAKYHHIDTLEREELCDFILKAAKQTGFSSNEDATEEWREW